MDEAPPEPVRHVVTGCQDMVDNSFYRCIGEAGLIFSQGTNGDRGLFARKIGRSDSDDGAAIGYYLIIACREQREV